jgi:membrane fusion protein (multidrug efflux system)
MTKRMIIMLLLTGLVFGAVFGMKWFGNKMMIQYVEHMPVPSATITAGAVKAMTWDNSLEAIGTLVPVNGADVTTESGGIVTAIRFEAGDHVKAGAPLITLSSANERAELKKLESQAALAELNLSRREKLLKLEAISKSDYDTAASEASVAKSAVDAQRAKLAQKEIHAPFAGVLGIRQVNLGQFLAPGTSIVTLQSLDPINVDFSLPEQLTGIVQPGFKIYVRVDSFPNDQFEGTVLAIEPRVDEATRSFKLRARIRNTGLKLRAGQFGRVRLELPGERQLLVVPRTAISYNSYGTSVFVVEKRKAAESTAEAPAPNAPPVAELEVTQRFVKIGDSRGDYVAVVEGLKEGDQVATSGLLKLRNGQPVIIDNKIQPDTQLKPVPAEG